MNMLWELLSYSKGTVVGQGRIEGSGVRRTITYRGLERSAMCLQNGSNAACELQSVEQTRVSRLSSMNSFLVYKTAPPDRCRNRELGCHSNSLKGNFGPLLAVNKGGGFVGAAPGPVALALGHKPSSQTFPDDERSAAPFCPQGGSEELQSILGAHRH